MYVLEFLEKQNRESEIHTEKNRYTDRDRSAHVKVQNLQGRDPGMLQFVSTLLL